MSSALLTCDSSDFKNHSKESVHVAEDPGSIPGLGRSPGEGNGNPLQYSCLENPMDRGAWWAAVRRGYKESDTTEATNTFTFTALLTCHNSDFKNDYVQKHA